MKLKVTFGHKVCYEIKVMFGENSLKLRQTNWNVAKNNVNVVVDELPSQIYSLHLFSNWYLDLTVSTPINVVLCALVPSVQNGRLPVKLVPKVFDFTMDTPSSPESAQWELCNAHNFVLKVRRMTLSPQIF